jgi:hypothetical protein
VLPTPNPADTRPNRFALAEETAALAAVTPAGDDKLAAALHPSPELAPDPGAFPGVEEREEWRTEHLSEDAQIVHSLACACDWGGHVELHGGDFEDIAAAWSARAVARALDTGTVVRAQDVPARYPVEAKVSAGAWGALAAGVGLAVVNLLLAHLELIPSLLGGERPWVGALVLVLGAVLPAVKGALDAYRAPHTPRAGS